MITILPIAMGTVFGIGLYACAYHFLVGMRQRPHNPVHLTFALLMLTVTGQILADGIARMADTLSLAVFSFKLGITLAALTVIALTWFIALYTRVKPRWFLVILTAITGIIGLINIVRPSGFHITGGVSRPQADLRHLGLDWRSLSPGIPVGVHLPLPGRRR